MEEGGGGEWVLRFQFKYSIEVYESCSGGDLFFNASAQSLLSRVSHRKALNLSKNNAVYVSLFHASCIIKRVQHALPHASLLVEQQKRHLIRAAQRLLRWCNKWCTVFKHKTSASILFDFLEKRATWQRDFVSMPAFRTILTRLQYCSALCSYWVYKQSIFT